MTNAMPADGKRVPIKDANGVVIGEVTDAEFDVGTQEIRFTGKLDTGQQFSASQIVGLSFGPQDVVAVKKNKHALSCGCYGGPHGGYTDPRCR